MDQNKTEILKLISISMLILLFYYIVSSLNYVGFSDGDDSNYLDLFGQTPFVPDVQHLNIVLLFNSIFLLITFLIIIILKKKEQSFRKLFFNILAINSIYLLTYLFIYLDKFYYLGYFSDLNFFSWSILLILLLFLLSFLLSLIIYLFKK